ncbi:hypothetical protein J32TS6_04780 [Virgibacillus pantothenticus]|uniref:hypothetical protein n=1 Tax=Virgibacillus TaxID=84406 RepID=UPI0012EB8CC7|nr:MULTISPECIES: hypothetical protein [Virgibacillus]MBS7427027.1 hypothetical protein [Virgibacillus sp. 19R1-5]MBU8568113.1 hypothetical protein [Virgibacillus pantothenticus]MBU8602059.1 hypothetical protein [Virgibacillus pantothenticus]MBU8636309.1 hypothetical protein [Virgibacillus pantothenticus]MBU8643829.1 hypothetical protein [Virgibacillus pantothenticus]
MEDRQENVVESQLEKYREGKELTAEYVVEGVGAAKVYRMLDLEALVKRLLQMKYINC